MWGLWNGCMLYTVNCGTGGDNYSMLERDGIHTCIIQQNLWSWNGCILYTVNCGTGGDNYTTSERDGIHMCIIHQKLWS